jgi:ferredoxin-NADP reductase
MFALSLAAAIVVVNLCGSATADAVVSPTYFLLGNRMAIQWNVYPANATTPQAVEFTLQTSGVNRWVGVGFATSGMDGPIVICTYNTQGSCGNFNGGMFSPSRQATMLQYVSGSMNASSWFQATFRMNTSNFNIVTGPQRMIVAFGTWDTTSNFPRKHADDSRTPLTVNILAGEIPSATTVAPATTPTPGAPSVTSPTYFLLGNRMAIQWNVYPANATTPQAVEFTLQTSGVNRWVGVGFATSGMDGPIVICTYNTQGSCGNFNGGMFSPTRQATMLQYVSGSMNASSWFQATFRMNTSNFNIVTGPQRMIVAFGTWNTTRNFPQKHAGDSRTPLTVNILAGEILPATTVAPATTLAPGAPSVVSPTYFLLGNRMAIQWNVYPANATTPQAVEFTLQTSGVNRWVGVGFATSGMDGPIVICTYNTQGSCGNFNGGMFSPSRQATMLQYVSGSMNASSWFQATFRMNTSNFNIVTGPQRMIVAFGTWDTASNFPQKHSSGSASPFTVNILAGVIPSLTTPAPGGSTPVPTPPPATTPIPSSGTIPVSGSAIMVSTATRVLNDRATLQWNVYNGIADSKVIEFTLQTAGMDNWVGIGFAADAMNGPIVMCTFDPVAHGSCGNYNGDGYSPTRLSTTLEYMSGSYDGTSQQFATRFRVRTADMNILDGRQRMITAIGRYDMSINFPLQHAADGRMGFVVDILAGTVTLEASHENQTIAIALIASISATALLIALLMNFLKVDLQPAKAQWLSAVAFLLLLAAPVFYGAMCYKDHVHDLSPWPEARSFGNAAAMIFWFLLYPVQKHFNIPARAGGSSYQRFLPYHMWLAFLVAIISTVHMGWMIYNLKSPSNIFSAVGERPPLFGFLAWCGVVVIALPSITLRKRWYWSLKAAHGLAIPTLIMACIHHRPLIFALIPPVAIYLCDYVARAVSHFANAPTIVEATPYAKGGFTKLTIRLGRHPWAGGGSFALLGLQAAGIVHPHPFSIAWYSAERKEATFFIKAMGSGTWTRTLHEHAQEAAFASTAKLRWHGSFGRLQTKLGRTTTVVLVGGGIGITPLLNLARLIQENPNGALEVVVLWALREPELFEVTRDLWAQAWPRKDRDLADERGSVQSLVGSDERFAMLYHFPKDVPFYGELFGTELSIADPVPFSAVQRRRIVPKDDIPRLLKQAARGENEPITIYSCGPAALMDDVRAFAKSRPATWLHEETFGF